MSTKTLSTKKVSSRFAQLSKDQLGQVSGGEAFHCLKDDLLGVCGGGRWSGATSYPLPRTPRV